MNIPLNPIESHEIPIKKSHSPAIWWLPFGDQNTSKHSIRRSAPGNFSPTVGWEDLFKPQLIDAGAFYASKEQDPSHGNATDGFVNDSVLG